MWDDEIRGFDVRCQQRAKTYILKYRHSGRQRWLTIGRRGSPWTPAQAREEALRLLGALAHKVDPASARDKEKAAPTVKKLIERYVEKHGATLKPRTVAEYKPLRDRFVLPEIGTTKAHAVTRQDIEEIHRKLANTPRQANDCLAFLSGVMNFAERVDVRPTGSNPCRHVRRYAEGRRERFLSNAELADLGKVWLRIRKKACLEDVRLHDLRHSHASAGAAGGVPLQVLRLILGHRSVTTTTRYAHLAQDPVQVAADTIGKHISDAMQPKQGGEVVPLKQAGHDGE